MEIRRHRSRFYAMVAIAISVWMTAYIYIVASVIPTAIHWLTYYAVNYRGGFVRRGLAGQILTVFPDHLYFPVALTLMWGSVATYGAATGILMVRVLRTGRPSERRLLVALLIPALPFAFIFALFGPRPELYAAAATIAYAAVLAHSESVRTAAFASGLFGLAMAAMAFVHEAIPLEFALGAVLTITVLGPPHGRVPRFGLIGLSLVPGLSALAVISSAGKQRSSQQLCEQVPHRNMPNTLNVPPDKVFDYLLGRYDNVQDFHDWACTKVLPYFDADFAAGFRAVIHLGPAVLIGGFLHGAVVFAATLWLLQFFTRVPWSRFRNCLQGGLVVPGLAAALMLPLFATGVDWIRWWMIILINVAAVYLLFAADEPEIEESVSRRDRRIFVAVLIVLMMIPFAAPSNYSTQWVTS